MYYISTQNFSFLSISDTLNFWTVTQSASGTWLPMGTRGWTSLSIPWSWHKWYSSSHWPWSTRNQRSKILERQLGLSSSLHSLFLAGRSRFLDQFCSSWHWWDNLIIAILTCLWLKASWKWIPQNCFKWPFMVSLSPAAHNLHYNILVPCFSERKHAT